MSSARTRHNPDSNDEFLFLGNQLALDFLNTRPFPKREPIELLPDFSVLSRWFRAAKLLSARDAVTLREKWGESAQARRTVEAIRELRERLRREILAWKRSGAVSQPTADELNRLMARYPMRTKLKAGGRRSSMELYFEPQQPQDFFAPLAHSAATLFAHTDRNRVRKCDNCVLHFLDTSKNGTRRWCSMQLCGNRLKVAAYRARQGVRSRMSKRP
jgi:predicted RNA-binding Zn ribbon-like protein